ncbi:MAG: endonuclease/exonuclease/phosphatase family protein [Candidatus Saccharibacteria bacterium]
MKLVQLNAWGGRLEHQLADLLTAEAANLVCLQEIISASGDALMALTLEELQATLGLGHSFMSPVMSFNLMNKTAAFGNAILSEYPLTQQNTIFTNLQYQAAFDFDSHDYNIRNLQHAQLTVAGHKLHLLNHHGHHIRQHKNGDAQTRRQMTQIAAYVATLDGPVILTGDFNLAPHSESLELLNGRLRNLSIEYKLTTTRNSLTTKNEVCDYIFVNDAVTVQGFRASDVVASDHQALILDFQLSPQAPTRLAS